MQNGFSSSTPLDTQKKVFTDAKKRLELVEDGAVILRMANEDYFGPALISGQPDEILRSLGIKDSMTLQEILKRMESYTSSEKNKKFEAAMDAEEEAIKALIQQTKEGTVQTLFSDIPKTENGASRWAFDQVIGICAEVRFFCDRVVRRKAGGMVEVN